MGPTYLVNTCRVVVGYGVAKEEAVDEVGTREGEQIMWGSGPTLHTPKLQLGAQ